MRCDAPRPPRRGGRRGERERQRRAGPVKSRPASSPHASQVLLLYEYSLEVDTNSSCQQQGDTWQILFFFPHILFFGSSFSFARDDGTESSATHRRPVSYYLPTSSFFSLISRHLVFSLTYTPLPPSPIMRVLNSHASGVPAGGRTPQWRPLSFESHWIPASKIRPSISNLNIP